jgi:uncharacterized membrane protein (DUF4010 family)
LDVFDLFQRLGVALAIGLLVGIERGWQLRAEAEGERTAGLRTFALSGLLGGIAAALSAVTAPVTLGLFALAYTAAFAAFHFLEASRDNDFSVTGVVAGILTFALGAYAVLGDLTVAVAGAVAMTALLALKQPLHRWVRALSWVEIRAGLILLAMTFLLLPILPDRPVDPWGAVNPREIWLFAILMAAVSFAGYWAVKLVGDRAGIAVAGLAGGLASSTATTLTLARMSKAAGGGETLLAGGILLAGAVMFVRVAAIASAVQPALLPALAPPVIGAALAFLVLGFALVRRGGDGAAQAGLKLENPFELATVLKFSAFVAVVMAGATIVNDWVGAAGTFVVAAASGLADVDAITLSMARLAGGSIDTWTATLAIALAAAVNSFVKVALAGTAGTPRLALTLAVATTIGLAVGGAAMLACPAGACFGGAAGG